MASVERLVHYGHQLPQEAPARIAETAPPTSWPDQGVISFDHIELRYRPELPPVIHDLSLEIRAGEKIGVVGRYVGLDSLLDHDRANQCVVIVFVQNWSGKELTYSRALSNGRDFKGQDCHRWTRYQQARTRSATRTSIDHPSRTCLVQWYYSVSHISVSSARLLN